MPVSGVRIENSKANSKNPKTNCQLISDRELDSQSGVMTASSINEIVKTSA